MIENNKDNSIYDSPDFRPFTNDKIFMNVMRSPKICRALLELILPNEEIGAIRIKKSDNPFVDNSEIDEDLDGNMNESDAVDKDSEQTDSLENLSVETQKTLKLEADAHGVRFDAFVESSKLWADIEMQTSDGLELDKRARYYHANMDMLDAANRGDIFPADRPVRTKIREEVSTYYGEHSSSLNCLVADNCIIEGEIENCIVFSGARISAGAKLKDCIIMRRCTVGENSELNHVIADKAVVFSAGTVLTGSDRLPIVVPKGIEI